MCQVGTFKVVAEAGIASGVRRIEAVAGPAAVEHLGSMDGLVRQLAGSLKVKPEEVRHGGRSPQGSGAGEGHLVHSTSCWVALHLRALLLHGCCRWRPAPCWRGRPADGGTLCGV